MHRFILPMMLAASTPAVADTHCAGLTDALAGLATNYGEHPRVTALMTDGNMLIITAAPQGGWTAMAVNPDGTACIVASGEGFGIVDAPPAGDPA